jgi:hypothetical protein
LWVTLGIVRIALFLGLLSLSGCAAITGVGDLQVDPTYDPDAGQKPPTSGTPSTDAAAETSAPDTGSAMEAATEAAVDAPSCEGTTFGGHCYFLLGATKDFAGAKDGCAAKSAHLVVITSSEEQTAVQAIGSGERWIGLTRTDPVTDLTDKTNFKWVDGETSSYENWLAGEPNDGPCVRMNGTGAWLDRVCEVTATKPALEALCERD